ncbi:hypothetical protein HWV62_35474 [Athelia sp. TMB]|nr:hypothetical protein HWV62_35474 [Athelia sp. TMB]
MGKQLSTGVGYKPAYSDSKAHDAVPILNLPVEVLNEIFELGPRETLRNINNSSTTNRPAIWREVATHNPFLWTRITVDFSRSTSLSKLYLERSRNAELDIRVLIRYKAHAESFATMLLADIKRCRGLNMSFPSYPAAFTTLHILQQLRAPVLRACKVLVEADTIHYEDEDDTVTAPTSLFVGGAPMLSSLRLDGISALGCRFHLNTVTHLELKVDSFSRQLTFEEASGILLEASPILSHLTLDGFVFNHLLGIKPHPLELPVLTSLDLRLSFAHDGPRRHDALSQDYILFVWRFLRVPSLERLSLFNLSEVQFYDTIVAVGKQRDSGQTGVTHLSLDAIGIRGTLNAADLTFFCPNVVDLKIRGPLVQPLLSIFSDGTRADGDVSSSTDSTIFLPFLQSLSVSTSNDKLLRAAILTRKALGAPIPILRLVGRNTWSEHTIQWFRARVDFVSTHDDIFA